jgi:hypothetical protein
MVLTMKTVFAGALKTIIDEVEGHDDPIKDGLMWGGYGISES